MCVCVGEIISLPWFSKELKNDLLLVHGLIFIGWGSPFPIVLVDSPKNVPQHRQTPLESSGKVSA